MITIIAGTNSADSMSSRVAEIYKQELMDRGEECQIADLRNLPSDFINNEMYYSRSASFEQWQAKYLFSAEKFMMIVPEYNGGFPGILKLMIDASDHITCWKGKKAMLCGLSAGRAGNLRGMDHLTNVLNYLKVHVHHNKLPISLIGALVTDRTLTDEVTLGLISAQVDDLVAF